MARSILLCEPHQGSKGSLVGKEVIVYMGLGEGGGATGVCEEEVEGRLGD